MINNIILWMAAISTNLIMLGICGFIIAYGGVVIITMKKLKLGLVLMFLGAIFPVLCYMCAQTIT